jgi:hypothetical protein
LLPNREAVSTEAVEAREAANRAAVEAANREVVEATAAEPTEVAEVAQASEAAEAAAAAEAVEAAAYGLDPSGSAREWISGAEGSVFSVSRFGTCETKTDGVGWHVVGK